MTDAPDFSDARLLYDLIAEAEGREPSDALADDRIPPWLVDAIGGEDDRWYVEDQLAQQLARVWATDEARRVVRQHREAGEVYALPEPRSMLEQLAEADVEPSWSVEGLHEQGSSTIVVAEAKAGKSTLALNLVRSLLTGRPFLDQFDVDLDADARILFLNYELSEAMFKRWVLRMGLGDDETERLIAYHLRGRRLPPDHPHARHQLVERIQELGEVAWVIVDPLQRAFLGDSNNNDEVGAFLEALDALKAEAEVPNLLLIDHTGHTEKGRARGASVKAGWPDSTWALTRENGHRNFAAFGRDVDVASTPLRFDPETLRLSMGDTPAPRRETRPLSPVDRVLVALAESGDDVEVKGGELTRAIRGLTNAKRPDAIRRAVDAGFVAVREGGGTTRWHRLTDTGRERLEEVTS